MTQCCRLFLNITNKLCCCLFLSELVEEKVFLKEQTENTEGKLNLINHSIQFEVNTYNSTITVGIIFPESTSGLSVGTANCQKDLLVINFDLEPECPDAELRATLQWIAASELGIPTIYFKKSQENRIEKVVFTELGTILIHFNRSNSYDVLKLLSLKAILLSLKAILFQFTICWRHH